jgi:hypothetical protein
MLATVDQAAPREPEGGLALAHSVLREVEHGRPVRGR